MLHFYFDYGYYSIELRQDLEAAWPAKSVTAVNPASIGNAIFGLGIHAVRIVHVKGGLRWHWPENGEQCEGDDDLGVLGHEEAVPVVPVGDNVEEVPTSKAASSSIGAGADSTTAGTRGWTSNCWRHFHFSIASHFHYRTWCT